MKRTILIIITLVGAVGGCLIPVSCRAENSHNILQVWSDNGTDWVGNAIPFGDGTTALTVVNYEYNTTESKFQVKWPGHGQYHASIQAIDPVTSVTLLKLETANIPPVAIGDSDAIKTNDKVTIRSWGYIQKDKLILSKKTTDFYGYDKVLILEGGPYMEPGAAVINGQGKIIGLIGTFYDAFVFRLGGPGMTAPISNIKKAIENLSNIHDPSWVNQPAYFLKTAKFIPTNTGNASAETIELSRNKYNEITEAIQPLLKTMGEPLPANELPQDYRNFLMKQQTSLDGSFLSVIYINPVKLSNSSGQAAAEAKWVSLQWGRSENKPNLIYYGTIHNGTAMAAGGFILEGDTGPLENTISQINFLGY